MHPFFQVTFLAAKREHLPIGSAKSTRLDGVTDRFLKDHFRLHPKSEHFFMPYRGAGKEDRWVNPDYASSGLQTINTQTFKDVWIHPPKSKEWGWKADYVEILHKHVQRRIPIWPLVVWVYKVMPLDDAATPVSLVGQFLREFSITQEEVDALFDNTLPASDASTFQDIPVEWHEIIGQESFPRDVGPDKGGTLSYLEMSWVGPVSKLIFNPGSRLNIITGDNSLGKSFLLDVIWWALTGAWVGEEITPYRSPLRQGETPPRITFQLAATIRTQPQKCLFSFETYTWSRPTKQQVMPGLVVYARADGSFAIWDPARRANPAQKPFLLLTREHVWHGDPGRIEGVVRDWGTWQRTPDSPFELFLKVLARISPPELGKLAPGKPMRLPFVSHQEIPTISHPYGDVPIIHESAGVRRMISLAYVIVWAWHQHRFSAEFLGRAAERQLVVLVDELEAHLHPRWQRVILPALLGVLNDLSSELNSQIFVATHSPLVLASAEPVFRQEADKLHSLETTASGKVVFEELPFVARGRVDEWLRSRAFGMNEPRSKPAAEAIRLAKELQEKEVIRSEEVQQVHQALVESIPPGDTFWARWLLFAKKHGAKV